jgi:hypothetical protein
MFLGDPFGVIFFCIFEEFEKWHGIFDVYAL